MGARIWLPGDRWPARATEQDADVTFRARVCKESAKTSASEVLRGDSLRHHLTSPLSMAGRRGILGRLRARSHEPDGASTPEEPDQPVEDQLPADPLDDEIERLRTEARERVRSEVQRLRTEAEERRREERDARERLERENEELRRRLEESGSEPADPDAELGERIARIEADADERLRSEVGVARKAAEERFAEKLAAREQDLERERQMMVEAEEAAERRLSGIEARLLEAVERVATAERLLAEKAAVDEAGPEDTAQWAASPLEARTDEPAAPAEAEPTSEGRVSVTRAGADELRSAGLSASQARRVIRYRDERRLDSVAGLEEIPGFPRSLLDSLAGRLRD